MIRINLLPVRAAQKKEKLRSQASILLLCLLLVSAVCGALYMQQMLANGNLKKDIALIDQENAKLKVELGKVANIEKETADLEKKLAILDSLQADRTGPVRLLDELINALPEKVWLTQYTEKNGKISLDGFGDSENTVAKFMNNLEMSPKYKSVVLNVTEQSAVGGIKMQKFTLSCLAEASPSK